MVEKFDPATQALVATYTLLSSWLIVSLQPVGPVLYLAGYDQGNNIVGSPTDLQLFAAFDTSTNTLTTIYEATTEAADVYGQFVTVTLFGGNLYVGGGRAYSNPYTGAYDSLNGYFYRYNLTRDRFTNESSRLSTPVDWLWATEPWGSTLLVYEGSFNSTPTTSGITGGIYRVNRPGPMLGNLSSLLPSTFVGDLSFITAESGDYLYQGGSNSASGLAELVALRL
jgi:hypothetical protein